MKFLVFGSLNIDHVYHLDHLVREGETASALSHDALAGGKGLNQALALCRAGQAVSFAGAVGQDGLFLKDLLEEAGADASDVSVLPGPSGHAVIQVDSLGRNAIVVYCGANRKITPEIIDRVLSRCAAGDWLLMQNEISCGKELFVRAAEKGLRVVLNPSPDPSAAREWPLEKADTLIFNELEGRELTGHSEPEKILDALFLRCPYSRLVLTLGEEGAICADRGTRLYQRAFNVDAVDTTAAGDTFTGFFLAAAAGGKSAEKALPFAAAAAALAVGRPGATPSIPTADEVKAFLKKENKSE